WKSVKDAILEKCREWNAVTQEETLTCRETTLGDLRVWCAARSKQMTVHYDSRKLLITVKNAGRLEHEKDVILHIAGYRTGPERSDRAIRLIRNEQPVNIDVLIVGELRVVRLQKVVMPSMADVLVKLEYYNPTGSYKDRMALAMIEGAEARGELRPGMRVVEWTGGSTGSSLAMVCAIKGYHFTPISSDGFAKEKLQTMRIFGADLEIFPAEGGKLVPELYQRMKRRAEELAQQPGTFYTNQFNNADAIRAYMGIGTELAKQAGTGLAAFCGGVGTGGMIAGVSRALKEAGCKARIVALEPATSPVLTTGKGGPHRVEGIAA